MKKKKKWNKKEWSPVICFTRCKRKKSLSVTFMIYHLTSLEDSIKNKNQELLNYKNSYLSKNFNSIGTPQESQTLQYDPSSVFVTA